MTARARSLVTACLAGLLLSVARSSEAVAPESSWRERARLTGDWGGVRTALADLGLYFDAEYTSGFWSNLHGGFKTGTTYEGFATWGARVDLERAFGWRGGSIESSWYSYHGGQPSEDLVGPYPSQTVSGNEAAEAVRFFEIFLRQRFCNGRIELKAGQLSADADFFVSEYADLFENGGFGLRGVGRDAATAPFYPLAAPGASLRASSADGHWQAQLGAYAADAGDDVEDNLGFDYAFDGGAFLMGEFSATRRPFGLAGTYSIGVKGTSGDGVDFSGRRIGGSYGLYAQIDQQLLGESSERPSLGFFARAYGAPQQSRNLVSWYVELGIELTRPFKVRPRDSIGLGFSYLRFTEAYVDASRAQGDDVSRRETLIELTYRFQATGWLVLQPDLQFFFDPHFSRRDATVIGLRAVVTL